MGKINAVLAEEVDYGFEGGARYKTGKSDSPNGFKQKDSEWAYGLHEFEASFGDIPDAVRDFLIGVFHQCRGSRHDFMFYDWNDATVDAQLFQVGTVGTTEIVQAYKSYSGFGQAFTVRPLQALKWANIYDDTETLVPGTWDLLTGIFTPTDPWGAGPYTLDAEFYVWVAFGDDYNPMTINSWRANTAKVRLEQQPYPFFALNVPPNWDGAE